MKDKNKRLLIALIVAILISIPLLLLSIKLYKLQSDGFIKDCKPYIDKAPPFKWSDTLKSENYLNSLPAICDDFGLYYWELAGSTFCIMGILMMFITVILQYRQSK